MLSPPPVGKKKKVKCFVFQSIGNRCYYVSGTTKTAVEDLKSLMQGLCHHWEEETQSQEIQNV